MNKNFLDKLNKGLTQFRKMHGVNPNKIVLGCEETNFFANLAPFNGFTLLQRCKLKIEFVDDFSKFQLFYE